MNDDDKQRLIEDLKSIACSLDPAEREEVLKILAHFFDTWPDDAELMRIRLRYSEESE
jgi:hypothetical protein